MILITVEIIPPEITGKERDIIAMGKIINDGTGTKERGNYRFYLTGKRGTILKHGAVKMFPRKSYTAWNLLWRCLNEIFKSKS